MIIYGYRNRVIEQGTGNFYCPNCQVQRQYKRKKIVRYFTLFFIPIFPLGTLSEYIECGVCGRTYKPEILSVPAPAGVLSGSPPISDSMGQSFLQSVAGDQPAPEPKGNSCLPWVLILAGLLPLLGGFLMGIALIATQTDGSGDSDMASFIAAVILCPLPLVLLGVIAIGAGVYLHR
ncbi:MAG TPA: zinc ribbon domain-containing protein, partial [Anaerolineales bacterium]|nr:zinc ribbon domain-containing protein [Anaerolineales bacterium]